MKKLYSVVLVLALTAGLFGCSGAQKEIKQIKTEDVYYAYEALSERLGLQVDISNPPTDNDLPYYATVTARDLEGNMIIFHFCKTAADAESFAKERQWNGVLWFLSLVMGKSSWLTTTTYGNIEIEYDNPKLYEPFAQLIR